MVEGSLMIDWLTLEIPFVHDPIDSGRVISISPEEEIEWESEKRMTIRGSYESNLRIRSAGASAESEGKRFQLMFQKKTLRPLQQQAELGGQSFFISMEPHQYF